MGKVRARFGVKASALEREYDSTIKYYATYLHTNCTYDFPESDSEDEYDSCLVCGQHDHPSGDFALRQL